MYAHLFSIVVFLTCCSQTIIILTRDTRRDVSSSSHHLIHLNWRILQLTLLTYVINPTRHVWQFQSPVIHRQSHNCDSLRSPPTYFALTAATIYINWWCFTAREKTTIHFILDPHTPYNFPEIMHFARKVSILQTRTFCCCDLRASYFARPSVNIHFFFEIPFD